MLLRVFLAGGVLLLLGLLQGYVIQRRKGRRGPNSRALLYERVVAVRTDTRTNESRRVGGRSGIRRLLSRLHRA